MEILKMGLGNHYFYKVLGSNSRELDFGDPSNGFSLIWGWQKRFVNVSKYLYFFTVSEPIGKTL